MKKAIILLTLSLSAVAQQPEQKPPTVDEVTLHAMQERSDHLYDILSHLAEFKEWYQLQTSNIPQLADRVRQKQALEQKKQADAQKTTTQPK